MHSVDIEPELAKKLKKKKRKEDLKPYYEELFKPLTEKKPCPCSKKK
jgi:hypothetical protein